MQVTVNGESRELAPGITVRGLLDDLGVDAGRTVVEVNRTVLSRDEYDTAVINDGDVVELVEVVGGG